QAGEQLLQHYGKRAPRIAAQLAMHFERGRDFERAIEYLIQAGDNAAQLYANDEAEKHYSRALELVEKLPAEDQTKKKLTIFQKRGGNNLALSRFNEAVGDYNSMLQAAQAIHDPAVELGAAYRLNLAFFLSASLDGI